MSEKVVMTNLQFETVKGYLESYSKGMLAMNVAQSKFSAGNPLYDIAFEDLMIAIYRPEDVTIEKTPEEELFRIYESYANEENDFDENVRTGIEIALRTLGIKIPGIRE